MLRDELFLVNKVQRDGIDALMIHRTIARHPVVDSRRHRVVCLNAETDDADSDLEEPAEEPAEEVDRQTPSSIPMTLQGEPG